MPQSFNPTVPCCGTPWLCKRQLPHYTHLISHYVSSSSPESIVLSLPSFSSFLLTSLPHSVFLSHFFHCTSLFHLWPFLFIESLIFLALTLLSAKLSSPKLFHLSSFPCLTFLILLIFFFCLCLVFVLYQKVADSVIALPVHIWPLPFTFSIYVSLCSTDHPLVLFTRI